ncbi:MULTISPECIES: acylphosphatase [unclassified Agrococcus]|uniref:acylphosphatase n=1 Tax=unclassified Agrococcus TaxID=2615065 RepID=UPI0036192C2E
MTTRRVVTVHGSVQGVGFRWAAKQEADRLGVAGSARNLLDGSVEVVVEGDDDAVERMLAWLQHGPASATVAGAEQVEQEPQGTTGFAIH